MQHAGLDDRLGPDGVDGVLQALEAVADADQDVVDATVFQLGEDLMGELRALAAVADPEPEDLALAGDGDTDRGGDRAVGDLPVADLDVDRVDEDDRVDAIQGPVLPLAELVEDGIGDPTDRVLGDARAVDLGEVRLHLAGRQALRRQAQHQFVDARQPPLERFFTITGSNVPSRSRGTLIVTSPTSVTTVFGRVPLRLLRPLRPTAACLS